MPNGGNAEYDEMEMAMAMEKRVRHVGKCNNAAAYPVILLVPSPPTWGPRMLHVFDVERIRRPPKNGGAA